MAPEPEPSIAAGFTVAPRFVAARELFARARELELLSAWTWSTSDFRSIHPWRLRCGSVC